MLFTWNYIINQLDLNKKNCLLVKKNKINKLQGYIVQHKELANIS